MTQGFAILICVFVFPALIGWIHGRCHADPNTPEGRRYYARRP